MATKLRIFFDIPMAGVKKYGKADRGQNYFFINTALEKLCYFHNFATANDIREQGAQKRERCREK